MKRKKVVVTGANSYVGVNLIKLCIKKKIHVIAFCRNKNLLKSIFKKSKFLTFHHYELTKEIEFDLKKIGTIFHLANERMKKFENNFKIDPNIIAAKNLIKAVSTSKKINIIYLSSHLAYNGTLSYYAKTKFECEKILLKKDSTIIKVGFIFGGKPLGLFKNLVDQLNKIAIMPIIFPSAPLYPIHVNDLSESLISIALNKKNKKIILTLGQKNYIKIKQFFQILGLRYLNKNIIFIPLPSKFIYLITSVLSNFSKFFFNINERVAGIKSLSIMNIDNTVLEYKKNHLINTNNLLKKTINLKNNRSRI